jgi:hypothetical protein
MSDPYTRFKPVLDQCLEMLGRRSLEWPLHWVVMAPNGMMLKGRYNAADDPHPEFADQGEHSPEQFMAFPMHYLFVDSVGKGTHIVVRSFSKIELLGCG